MERIMTWEEIKESFPNEWLRVVDYEIDESGKLKSGKVLYHSPSKHEVYSKPLSGQSEAFWYTGKSSFSGLRSHVEHNDL
ncbi:MAG: hypothetical protein HYU97_08025 [Deltaproteobacteria bacterium]|nr:hypothetical protein [Deltaproteobacteria bacterium]